MSFRQEIEFFEEKLSAGGKKSDGGWITDKFGVSWNFGPGGIEEQLAVLEEAERSKKK